MRWVVLIVLLIGSPAWAQSPCSQSPDGEYGCNVHKSQDQTATPGNLFLVIENSSSATPHTQCTATESGVASKDCLEISDGDNTASEDWRILYNTNSLRLGPTSITIDADNAGSEPANGAGLFIEGGGGLDASLLYNSTLDQMVFNYGANAPYFVIQDYSTTNYDGALRMTGAITIDAPTNYWRGMQITSNVKYEQDATISNISSGFLSKPSISNDSDEASPDFGYYVAFYDNTTHIPNATTGAATLTAHESFVAAPVFSKTGGNSYTITGVYGMEYAPTVNSGVTVTTARGMYIGAFSGSGTVTTNIGIDIAAALGGSTSIGLRNASTEVFTPPGTQSLTADSDTITCTATFKKLSATAARNLTSDPQIADGQTGQLCILEATGANTITLDDAAGLNLTAQFPMGASDMLTLVFDGTDWIEIARANN